VAQSGHIDMANGIDGYGIRYIHPTRWPIVASEPDLLTVRVILDRGIVFLTADTSPTPPRHINVPISIQGDGARNIATIHRSRIQGNPDFLPVRIILDRGIVVIPTRDHPCAISRHINISFGVTGYSIRHSPTVQPSTVPGDPDFLSV